MASLKYHKDAKRWRVFWHITLPNGEVEKGSKSFREKQDGIKFKQRIERKEKQIKNATIVEVPYMDELVLEWKQFLINRYPKPPVFLLSFSSETRVSLDCDFADRLLHRPLFEKSDIVLKVLFVEL